MTRFRQLLQAWQLLLFLVAMFLALGALFSWTWLALFRAFVGYLIARYLVGSAITAAKEMES